MIPESLYRLNDRDVQARLIDPLLRAGTQTVANVTAQSNVYEVPVDSVLILLTASMNATPGAGQQITSMRITIIDPTSGAGSRIADDERTEAAGIAKSLNWSGYVVVPALSIVNVRANFSAGAVANTVNGWITGIVIPRGNIERL